MLEKLLATILIGAIGSIVFWKLRIPAGAMVGAIVFVGTFQIISGYGYFPKVIKIAIQIIAGAFLGQRITANDLRELRGVVKPSFQLFGGILCMTFCTGLLIHHLASVGLETALLSSMPGGMTDIVLIASDIGADPTQSTVLHLVRYLVALLILPQINIRICKRISKDSKNSPETAVPKNTQKPKSKRHLFITLLIASVSGIIGKLSGFPAGAMVFSAFTVAAYNIRTEQAYVPRPMKLVAQCMAGISTGVVITLQDVLRLRELLLPVILIIINCILINYFLGILIYKTNDLDLATSLFAAVPSGLSDMALISLELGGDAPKVIVLQLVRYLCVMTFMPSMIRFFAAWYPF